MISMTSPVRPEIVELPVCVGIALLERVVRSMLREIETNLDLAGLSFHVPIIGLLPPFASAPVASKAAATTTNTGCSLRHDIFMIPPAVRKEGDALIRASVEAE